MQNKSGFNYFLDGFNLVLKPGIKRFVFIPLTINLIIFSLVIFFSYQEILIFQNWIISKLPSFFEWLKFIIAPTIFVTVLVFIAFLFGTIMNWIAAPFNGLLAEKTEKLLTGQIQNDSGAFDVVKDIPRVLSREFLKLCYYVPRAIFFLILFFIPVVGPFIWFLFTAWMMAIQYCDYSFDNHKVPFKDMCYVLKKDKNQSITFGASVAFFSMIPILNFIVMPVAICGATAMWVDLYRKDYKLTKL